MPRMALEVNMSRFTFIITSRKKLFLCIILILFIILAAFSISKLNYPHTAQVIEVDNSITKPVISPENENRQLKGILSSILPSESKLLFENSSRGISDVYTPSEPPSITPKEVLEKGKTLSFIFTYTNEDYLRPIYSDTWKQAYYQGWLYLPRKIISARHNLFIYPDNSNDIFNMEGELGFNPSLSIDDQNYINIMIYNFDLQKVVQLENQIVLSGIPAKKGVQIISIKTNDIAIQNEDEQLSIQLCTPKGLELDYQTINFPQVPNGTDDFGAVEETFLNLSSVSNIVDENTILKQELKHYISDSPSPIYFQYNGGYQTANILSEIIDLENAINCSSPINYSILYDNKKYVSPIFHPEWKKHSDKDWCYIPRKMYLNMKKLFVLSSDKDVAFDLCAELGFFEEFPDISENQVGLLVSNFSVSAAHIFEDNILLSGSPSRTGIQVVGLDKEKLKKHKEYAVRLVTKDLCEIDVDVIKN